MILTLDFTDTSDFVTKLRSLTNSLNHTAQKIETETGNDYGLAGSISIMYLLIDSYEKKLTEGSGETA
ncbi:MAG: hypothetical protein IPM56_16175 [Ignavibacteriales bacterium]|nr:MAG: hypothetical protein IPM56_16175 [Ignavibacteriales bacterium]